MMAVSNPDRGVSRGAEPVHPEPGAADGAAGLAPDFVATAATVGVIAAGVALFEAALIPGMVIGGAAVLAPKVLSRLRRGLQPLLQSGRKPGDAAALPSQILHLGGPHGLAVTRSLAKTITFRIIVTTLDFTSNYVVLGEFATAAGLSGFALVAGPVFYFVHETAWNYYRPVREGETGVNISLPLRRSDPDAPQDAGGFTLSRVVAKTITFRTVATTMDFSANYLVTGDIVAATVLSAFGFVVGPFVYLGHEKAWDYYSPPGKGLVDLPALANPGLADPGLADPGLAKSALAPG
jgi:uncharacterized membrane protein